MINATMTAPITPVARGRLKATPLSSTGLSSKSPTVAPRGRVRMSATQNKDDTRNPGYATGSVIFLALVVIL